jgi:hypothetical protein
LEEGILELLMVKEDFFLPLLPLALPFFMAVAVRVKIRILIFLSGITRSKMKKPPKEFLFRREL